MSYYYLHEKIGGQGVKDTLSYVKKMRYHIKGTEHSENEIKGLIFAMLSPNKSCFSLTEYYF